MPSLPILTFGNSSTPATDKETTEIRVDIDRLVSSRLLIQANSGGGKSRAIRSLLEQTSGTVQQIVFDPEGEFATLRERFPFVLAGQGGEVPADPGSAKLLCRRIMELSVSAVLDLYDLKIAERRRFVRLFLEELMNLPRELWRPLVVVIDEAHVFCPERGAGEAESTEAVITLCTQGRKRGFCAVLATQRIAKLHKDAAAELLNKMIGRTGLDVDLRRAGDELGLDKEGRTELRYLSPGSFYTFGPAIENGQEIHLVRTGSVLTSHPEPGKIAPPPPPMPEAIRSLAAQFVDLPTSLKALDPERMNVRQQHKEKPETTLERIIVERIEVPVPVEVPVVRERDMERLDDLVRSILHSMSEVVATVNDVRLRMRGGSLPFATPSVLPEIPTKDAVPKLLSTSNLTYHRNLTHPQQRILNYLVTVTKLGIDRIKIQDIAFLAGNTSVSSGFLRNIEDLSNQGLIELYSGFVASTGNTIQHATLVIEIGKYDNCLSAWLDFLPGNASRILKIVASNYPEDISKSQILHRLRLFPDSISSSTAISHLESLGLVFEAKKSSYTVRKDLYSSIGLI